MTRQERQARMGQLQRQQAKYEKVWQPRILNALKQQIRPFTAYMLKNGYVDALAQINVLVKPDPIQKVLAALYTTIGSQSGNEQYKYINEKFGKELKAFGFNQLISDMMQAFFNLFGGERVQAITDTERARIRRELERAAADGLDTIEMAKILESEAITLARSRVIARTETSTASSKGSDLGARKLGLMMNKTWLSIHDHRTRRIPFNQTDHWTMDGVSIGMDDLFLVPSKLGADLMLTPHAGGAPANQVIQCRCRAIYEPIRDRSGRLIRV